MPAHHNRHRMSKIALRLSSALTTKHVSIGKLIYLNGGTIKQRTILGALLMVLLLHQLVKPASKNFFGFDGHSKSWGLGLNMTLQGNNVSALQNLNLSFAVWWKWLLKTFKQVSLQFLRSLLFLFFDNDKLITSITLLFCSLSANSISILSSWCLLLLNDVVGWRLVE